jgi:large subunit ribosomal protein L25
VVYGEGANEAATSIQVPEHEMHDILRHHASGNVLLNLELDGGDAQKVLLKEVQHHPLTGRLLHVDFRHVSLSEKLRITVPVEFVGEAVGVSQQGGTLEQLVRDVEIECLPGDLLERIEIDVSNLHIGETLNVSDIPFDETKFTMITDPSVAVAALAAPRVEEEAVAEEEEGEAAEPEVISEKKEGEGEPEAEAG